MSKVLYPRATAVAVKKATELPLHIVYTDTSDPLGAPVWRHYSSELVAKVAAWYHCRLVGFTKTAVLYTTEELKQLNG
jgi:hypothetical protein